VSKDANAFADAPTGVYATDPNFGTFLKGIMNQLWLCVISGQPAIGNQPPTPAVWARIKLELTVQALHL